MDNAQYLRVISSAGQGMGMFIYAGLLIRLNRRGLPDAIELRGVRLVALIVAFSLYGVLAIYLISGVVSRALTGQPYR